MTGDLNSAALLLCGTAILCVLIWRGEIDLFLLLGLIALWILMS